MIAKVKELEPYEIVIIGICSSFTFLMMFLVLLNTL